MKKAPEKKKADVDLRRCSRWSTCWKVVVCSAFPFFKCREKRENAVFLSGGVRNNNIDPCWTGVAGVLALT